MLYTISLITILTLKGALTTFEGILVLTGGGPARSTESLGLLMYNYAFKEFRAGYSNAISILVLVVVGLISILQIRASQKLEVEG